MKLFARDMVIALLALAVLLVVVRQLPEPTCWTQEDGSITCQVLPKEE